jgi:opacity protein-like surface antigen
LKKRILTIIILFTAVISAQQQFSSLADMPGAFSRIGFGARGIGMGNAMSAVTEGNLVSYYNPALSVFQENNSFQTSYSFLSLDRSLNFLNFTRKFDFYSAKDSSKPRSTAGISIGIINSGVSNIDGRDGQGNQTGPLQTSENQFFLGLANKFSDKVSVGISLKFYYYKLYEQITSTSFGIDIGGLYKINEHFNLSLMISDLNSKYKWDTGPLYGTDGGTTTENSFPLLKKIGLSYSNKDAKILVAVEFESSNGGTNIVRAGAEYNIIDRFYLRAGIDQLNFSNSDWPVKPSAGFSYFKKFGSIVIGVDYAFQIEQYSPQDRHIVGVSINF